MCNLIDTVKEDSLRALKDKDLERRAVLNTILADLADSNGKLPEGDEILPAAVKALKGYKKALSSGGDMQAYINYLESLLPAELSEDDLKKIVIANGLTSMKEAMPWFKSRPTYRFDANLLKQVLSSL